MNEPRPELSDAERDVLKALWEQGERPVRELLEVFTAQGRQWAYTTLQTLLTRLVSKGYVESTKAGNALNYRANITREEFLQERLSVLAEDVCDGTTSPLMLALVEGGKLSTAEIDQLRLLLDQMEADNAKNGGAL
jgi:BlaI family transcriptional regulator, penicillinase repressor